MEIRAFTATESHQKGSAPLGKQFTPCPSRQVDDSCPARPGEGLTLLLQLPARRIGAHCSVIAVNCFQGEQREAWEEMERELERSKMSSGDCSEGEGGEAGGREKGKGWGWRRGSRSALRSVISALSATLRAERGSEQAWARTQRGTGSLRPIRRGPWSHVHCTAWLPISWNLHLLSAKSEAPAAGRSRASWLFWNLSTSRNTDLALGAPGAAPALATA